MKHYSTQMNQSFDVGWAKLYPVSIQISAAKDHLQLIDTFFG